MALSITPPGRLPALWVYKCDARERAGYDSGDWSEVLPLARPFHWGGTESTRSNASRKAIRETIRSGDLVLAWQVDRAEAVGLCSVVEIQARGEWLDLVLESVCQFLPPVRLRQLRRSDSRLWKV